MAKPTDARPYLEATKSLWFAAVLLLPLILVYEIGMHHVGGANLSSELIAFALIRQGFETFNAHIATLPSFAVLMTLLIVHITHRQGWQIRPVHAVGAVGESILWMLPLIGLGLFTAHAMQALSSALLVGWQLDGATTSRLILLSIGAGIFEEWLFRLVGIAALHFLFVDLLRGPRWLGTSLAVTLSAIAFAFYHHLGHEQLELQLLVFRTLAGIWLGVVFLARGFAVTVLSHTFYDIVVVTLAGLYVD